VKFLCKVVDNLETWADFGQTRFLSHHFSFANETSFVRPSKLRVPGSSPGGITSLNTLKTLRIINPSKAFKQSIKVQCYASLCRQRHRAWAESAMAYYFSMWAKLTARICRLFLSLPSAYRHSNLELKFSTLDKKHKTSGRVYEPHVR